MRIAVQSISVSLSGRSVLSGVTFAVAAGNVVAVLGPNGAGKSTLLRAIAGVIRPAEGRILLDGLDTATLGRAEIGRRIAFLPQDRTVHWPLTVTSVVTLGRRPHGAGVDLACPVDTEAVARALATMDLADLVDRPVTELSGGERARVHLARVLAQETDIVVLDEPLAGLDPAHQLVLGAHIARLSRAGRTVILTLHDLTLALRLASRVVLLGGGRLIAEGPASTTLSAETIGEVFRIRVRIETIEGLPQVVPLGVL